MSEDLNRLAAADAAWWLTQSADFFSDSVSRNKTARARLMARKRFLDAAKRALPYYGLEPFWEQFKAWNRNTTWGSRHEDVAEAAIRGLWAEMQQALNRWKVGE